MASLFTLPNYALSLLEDDFHGGAAGMWQLDACVVTAAVASPEKMCVLCVTVTVLERALCRPLSATHLSRLLPPGSAGEVW